MAKKQIKRRKGKKTKKRVVFLVIELLVLCVLGMAAFGMTKFGKLDFNILDENKLEMYKDTGPYTNIALFGLDSREGETDSEVRSDSIMIASINNDTNEVKVVSVYRDTLLQQADGTYEKANAAYATGGPEEAVAMLNRNFDLDIKNYMSVNFNALADVIDLLGGIELELTGEEVHWTNGYCAETSKIVGRKTEELTKAGLQTLDGIQAVSFSRIRYTQGDDFKRAARQRIVLQKVMQKAQSANVVTLNKIVDKVFPQVSTSLSVSDLMGIAANVLQYKVGDMSGFPFEVTTSEAVKKHTGSYVVPVGLENNVVQLHSFLFGKEAYNPSEKVQEINSDIIYLTDIDPEIEVGIKDTSYETNGIDTAETE